MKARDRIFKDIPDLIARLGCTLVQKSDEEILEAGRRQVGIPPGNAYLFDNGVIAHSEELTKHNTLLYCLHEAIHHFHGVDGLMNEITMMGLEFALYGMIQDDAQRKSAFAFFGDSEDDEAFRIAWRVQDMGAAYFRSSGWQSIVDAGQPWITKTGRVRAEILKELA